MSIKKLFVVTAFCISFSFLNASKIQEKNLEVKRRIENLRTKNVQLIRDFLNSFTLLFSDEGGGAALASPLLLEEGGLPYKAHNQSYIEHEKVLNSQIGGAVDHFFNHVDKKLTSLANLHKDEGAFYSIQLSSTASLEYFFQHVQEPFCTQNSDCLVVNIGFPCPQHVVVSKQMYGETMRLMASNFRSRLGSFQDRVSIMTKARTISFESCPKLSAEPLPQCIQNRCSLQ